MLKRINNLLLTLLTPSDIQTSFCAVLETGRKPVLFSDQSNISNNHLKEEDEFDIEDEVDTGQTIAPKLVLPYKSEIDSDCSSPVLDVSKKRKKWMDVVVDKAQDKEVVLKKLKGMTDPPFGSKEPGPGATKVT